MVQHLLHIVESEATEDGKSSVQPEVLGERQSSDGSSRNEKGGKARDGDNGSTRQKGSTNVQVLLLLGSGTNERDRTHHGYSIQTGACDQSARGEGNQRSDEGGLSSVESSPEGVLWNVAFQESVNDVAKV